LSVADRLVVMGVAGAGKSVVGRTVARRWGVAYADADDFHAAESISKMRGGLALTGADRGPWLERIGRWLAERESAVVSCSALRREYRDVLRQWVPGVWFLHLAGDVEVVSARVQRRVDHFMPASLVRSQYAELEALQPDERGTTVDLTLPPKLIADQLERTVHLEGRSTL
jgi:gluconokinase